MKVNEFDVIKLKSGEEATILEIFEPTGDDIDCVLYSASQNGYL